MKRVARIILDLLEVHLPAIVVFILFFSMFAQVVLRYFFRHPSPEFFEISSYTFVWAVLLGVALANRYRNHIKFDILYNKFPRKVRLVLDIFFDSFFNILLIISLYPIVKQALWYRIIRSEVLEIPWAYLVMCLPLTMVLIVIHNSGFIVKNLSELFKRKTSEGEKS